MALITVREKDNPEGPLLEVDERWVARWPDDFDVVRGAEETAEADAAQGPSTQPKAPAPKDADGDQSARGRF